MGRAFTTVAKRPMPRRSSASASALEALEVAALAEHEEVVVVEDEDLDAALALHLDHLGGRVVRLAHPVALAGQSLLVPRGDAAKRAVRVATADC